MFFFAYMPHTCVLIESDHIFILKYICMTKLDNCLFANGTTEECSVNRFKGNRATGNLNIHIFESRRGHSFC